MKRIYIISLALLVMVSSCGVFKKSSSVELFNLESTAWQVELLNGKVVDTSAQGSYTINFNADATLAGKGACNLLRGSFEQGEGGEIKISPLGLTRMACPGMDIEAEYIQALEAATSFEVVDGKLQLLKGDEVIIELKSFE